MLFKHSTISGRAVRSFRGFWSVKATRIGNNPASNFAMFLVSDELHACYLVAFENDTLVAGPIKFRKLCFLIDAELLTSTLK